MGWRFHRVLNIIPGLLRLNIGKSGISASAGPRGADVNIGPHGAMASAGLSGTGLSYRQKVGHHISGIAVGLFIAALIFAGWRYSGGGLSPMPAPVQTQQTASAESDDDSGGIPIVTREAKSAGRIRAAHSHSEDANAGADVIAAATPASGIMYVHRNNSDLRGKPSTSSPAIKKLAKGEQVFLIALSDKWAQVQDGPLKGWVRASIIKDTPPGEKKPRRKTSGDDN